MINYALQLKGGSHHSAEPQVPRFLPTRRLEDAEQMQISGLSLCCWRSGRHDNQAPFSAGCLNLALTTFAYSFSH